MVLQDLNSRTVLREGEARELCKAALFWRPNGIGGPSAQVNDVLLELLEDESLQSAIQQQAFTHVPMDPGIDICAQVKLWA